MVGASRHPNESVTSDTRNTGTAKPAILQIVPRLDTGGAERSTIDVAEALIADGYAALVASEGGRMTEELKAAGGELIALAASSKSPVTILANALKLKRAIAARNVKLVHARSRAPAWSGLIAARLAGVPFVATYHGLYGASNALKRWYNSVMVRGAAVIANSDWTAKHIAAEYGAHAKRVVVIPRGVDPMRFDAAGIAPDRVSALRKSWGVAEDDVVVLLPGRLTRLKGQLVLIEALAQMKAEGTLDGLRAVLAGDAQGRDAYRAEVARAIEAAGLGDRVIVAGHVGDMAAAYLACDIALSASIYAESFGRVPVEAAVMGKPAIATDHGGARETVVAGQSGSLTPPGDAAALARALERMIAIGAEGRRAMGAKGRAHVLGRYTRERMCAATLALYREILGT
jgi:glycosyltransferase involved in cell wall biosynthesis